MFPKSHPLPLNFGGIESEYVGEHRYKENLDRPCQRRFLVLLFHPIKHGKIPKVRRKGNWAVSFKGRLSHSSPVARINSFLAVLAVVFLEVRAVAGGAAADSASPFLAHLDCRLDQQNSRKQTP